MVYRILDKEKKCYDRKKSLETKPLELRKAEEVMSGNNSQINKIINRGSLKFGKLIGQIDENGHSIPVYIIDAFSIRVEE